MKRQKVVLATPHHRHDALEAKLRERHGLDVLRVRNREDLNLETLQVFVPRYLFLPHWSWRVPVEIHESYETVIFHMTDVPFGRGGTPLQNLVIRGIESTQLTALRCVEEMDAGPVYLKRPLSTLGTAEEVLLRASQLMEQMIVEIVQTEPVASRQQGEPVIFKRRSPDEGNVSSAASLNAIFDLIRMLDADGYPPAFLDVGEFRLEFSRASLRPGHVLADVKIVRREEHE